MSKTRALKLIEVTSQRQADNGTQCFHDPITNCDYLSYASGYVRRKYSFMNRRGLKITTIYQLNKKRHKLAELSSGYVYKIAYRVLEMDPNSRMEIICRAVVNYRKK